MTTKQVLLAPVPAEHLASALEVPALSERVAFGSSANTILGIPSGIDVYIYASNPPHPLFRPSVASWCGTLGAIVPAVKKGPRSGRHPEPDVRPPSAEEKDGPFMAFWEVRDLRRLKPAEQVALQDFKNDKGDKAFGGAVPEWPVLARLTS